MFLYRQLHRDVSAIEQSRDMFVRWLVSQPDGRPRRVLLSRIGGLPCPVSVDLWAGDRCTLPPTGAAAVTVVPHCGDRVADRWRQGGKYFSKLATTAATGTTAHKSPDSIKTDGSIWLPVSPSSKERPCAVSSRTTL